MTGRLILAAMVLGLLGGCAGLSDSGLNPFNWFGRSTSVEEAALLRDSLQTRDIRGRIDRITELSVERKPGGAILRVTGLAARQGYWNAGLTELPTDAPDTLALAFRISPPFERTRVSTPQSREIEVGLFLSDQDLSGIREIRVEGQRNALAVRR